MSVTTHPADLIKGLGFIGVALFVAYHTSIAWVGALAILAIGYFVSQDLMVTKIHADGADIFWVKVKQGDPSLEIDKGKLVAYTPQWHRLVGAYSCVAVLYATLLMLIIKPSEANDFTYFSWFIGHIFWIAALLIFYVSVTDQALERVALKVKKSSAEREDALRVGYQEILTKITKITAVHEKFGLGVSDLYDDEIEDFLNGNMVEIIDGGVVPCETVASIAKEIHDDYAPLMAAVNRYDVVMEKTRRVSLEMVATDFSSLRDEINGYSEHLTSTRFLSQLRQRGFSAFNQYLGVVDAGLDTILAAVQRQEAEKILSRKRLVSNRGNLTDKERAYQLLELPNNASMAEVKIQYRKMAQEYHPDKAEQTTVGIREMAQQRFIEIRWAFSFLKRNGY